MDQQEATRAVIVCGLRAGRTMKEIMSYGNINKSSVYDIQSNFEKFIASGRSADTVLTARKETVLAADLDELVTRDLGRSPPFPPPPPPSAGYEHFQNKYERIVSKDAPT